jgi:hypothetical protein
LASVDWGKLVAGFASVLVGELAVARVAGPAGWGTIVGGAVDEGNSSTNDFGLNISEKSGPICRPCFAKITGVGFASSLMRTL